METLFPSSSLTRSESEIINERTTTADCMGELTGLAADSWPQAKTSGRHPSQTSQIAAGAAAQNLKITSALVLGLLQHIVIIVSAGCGRRKSRSRAEYRCIGGLIDTA